MKRTDITIFGQWNDSALRPTDRRRAWLQASLHVALNRSTCSARDFVSGKGIIIYIFCVSAQTKITVN